MNLRPDVFRQTPLILYNYFEMMRLYLTLTSSISRVIEDILQIKGFIVEIFPTFLQFLGKNPVT